MLFFWYLHLSKVNLFLVYLSLIFIFSVVDLWLFKNPYFANRWAYEGAPKRKAVYFVGGDWGILKMLLYQYIV